MKFLIPLLCILLASVLEIKADEDPCLALAYCSLVRGDLAKELNRTDSEKFYKEAETAVGNYEKYPQKKYDPVLLKKDCEILHKTCIEETARVAVEDMKFPPKYRTSCSYRGYSNTIFDCKNIKYWPKKVKDVLPQGYKDCMTACAIVETTDVKLANGKILNRNSAFGYWSVD